MPQGRRKIPFSGKAKKVQMQTKRDKQQHRKESHHHPSVEERPEVPVGDGRKTDDAIVVEHNPHYLGPMELMPELLPAGASRGKGKTQVERYQLRFKQETKAELAAKKEKALQPLKRITCQSELEMSVEGCFPASLDFPVRPDWNPTMEKWKIDASEAKYFMEYVNTIFRKHQDVTLSYFELNLETWRQLWRVIEKSDVLLLIVDARYPAAMFPPSLYQHLTNEGKGFILVLNKVDLIPAEVALAWKDYFVKTFPQLDVVFFSSCPTYNLCAGLTNQAGLKFRRLRGKISMVTEGAKQIYDACKRIADENGKFNLVSWANKIEGQESSSDEENANVFTLGMLGQPNAGKSSLINSLMGKKVVSVSKTPGHTKHFQTMFITKSVVLCDCPGLVFPSLAERPLQVLLGSYPISQVREPFSVVQFLAEKLDLVKLLNLHLELRSFEIDESSLSAFDICELWANNRGYVTARSNRPDVNRAANHIMRMALDGKITLSYLPPGYAGVNLAAEYENHKDMKTISELLGLNVVVDHEPDETGSDEEPSDCDSDPSPTQTVANKFNVLLNE